MRIKALTLLVTVALPLFAQAELVVRDGQLVPPEEQSKFFPVATARNGNPSGLPTVKVGKTAPRSDSAAMANGFFRIDRSRTMGVTATQPLVIKVPANETASSTPRVIYGGSNHTNSPVTAASNTNTILQNAANMPISNVTSTAIDGFTNTAGSGPILSLFGDEAHAQAPSFREALSAGKLSALVPITIQHQWPVAQNMSQRLSSNYGFRASPFNSATQFHGGIDIASPIGTPVMSSADGVVSSVGVEGGYGKTIVIQHSDGSESRYSHLNTDNVTTGQNVKSGQMIATVGASGHATGPHLDYRLSKDGVSIDPLKVLNASNMAQSSLPMKQLKPSRPTQTASRERIIIVQ